MVSDTTLRVSEKTDDEVNARIQRQTEDRVSYYASVGSGAIEIRLRELDHEWDTERALEMNAAGLTLVAVVLGLAYDRKWLLLPGVIAGFLLQHAVQGWCPPLPLLRRLGFRTAAEINRERYALNALRGDFREVEPATNEQVPRKATVALQAVDR